MKIKKYLSILVMFFLIINIVIANESLSTNPQTNEIAKQAEETNTPTNNPESTIETKQTDVKTISPPEEITKNNNEENQIVKEEPTTEENNFDEEEVKTNVPAQENNENSSEVNAPVSNSEENNTNNENISDELIKNFKIENQTKISEENLTKTFENKTSEENQNNSYVNIEEINPGSGSSSHCNETLLETNDNQISNSENNEVNQTIKLTLFKNGEKEIEGEIPADFDEKNIVKQEKVLESGKFSKEVTIKSNEHLETPLTVYSDIPETKKENIKLFWKNENKEIEIKEYFDEDNDGLIERISWVVPHLSEQIFTITINTHEEGSSDEILINAVVNSSVNPIKFNFTVSYNTTGNYDLNCSLEISNTTESIKTEYFSPSQEKSFQLNFPNGDYNWTALCWEINNQSNNASTNGNFEIDESFSIKENNQIWNENNEGFYFLDLVKNKIENPKTISISSENNSNMTIKIIKGNQVIKTINYYGKNYDLKLNESILNAAGKYILNATFNKPSAKKTISRNFTVASAEININDENIKVGEDPGISININSPAEKIDSMMYTFGDETPGAESVNNESITKTLPHTYLSEGNPVFNLTFFIGQDVFSISKQITVTTPDNTNDTTNPEINLIEPENNAKFIDQTINFKYNATDNVKLSNCKYELFYNSILNYSENKTFSSSYGEDTISLYDFSVGDYSWDVICYDNSSNYEWSEIRKFQIVSSGYEALTYPEESEVSEVKAMLDDFLTDVDSQGPEVKQALEDLGIYSELELYQKRIQAIKIYFQTGYKTVSADKREEREKEYLDELENMKQKIPVSIEIAKMDEYVKNSITENLKTIIEKIVRDKFPSLSDRAVTRLTEDNFQIQNKLTASTQSKKIRLEYKNETKELTLITKKIKTNENGTLFEYLPDNNEEITFITKSKEVDDGLFEITPEDLIDGKIIYYTKGFTDVEDVKKTETIILREFSNEDLKGITGFSIANFGPGNSTNYLAAIIVLVILFLLVMKIKEKITIKKLSKEENVLRGFQYIKNSRESLAQNRVESAKYNYYKIKEIYPLLPEKIRKKMQKDLKKIKIGIDKREIINLVKEYEELKKEKKLQDAKVIYKKVQETYKELPKRYREKIYKRIFANPYDDFFR